MSSTSEKLHEILKNVYGYDSFRPNQEAIIQHVIQGEDSLVIMPTGGGKSLCFQIPALAQDGLSVVVSPLIALMQDQVNALQQNGVAAAALNSSMSKGEQMEVHQAIENNSLKLLYVSPERLNTPSFYDYLKRIKVNFFAIDEAHCVSIWGNDFRPDYVDLRHLKTHFPEIPIIALTATADEATRLDILKQLNIEHAKVFLQSFERTNLFIRSMPAQDRIKHILKFVQNHSDEAGIVYCLSRKSCESIAAKLQKAGINAGFYHAGMPASDRSRIQRQFQDDQIQVICATIAFGMGIDKSNIRFVVHYNMPKNIEAYYQEIGRAGRDGNPSATLLFSNYNDYTQLQRFILESDANQVFKDVQQAKLDRMWQFASSDACRTNFILNYFGEFQSEPCNRCDNCKQPPIKFDGTVLAQKALSAIARSGQNIGVDLSIAVLRGSGIREVFDRGLDKIKTYGVGRDLSYLDWKSYIIQMINQGLIQLDFSQGNILKLTPLSMAVLKNETKVELVEFKRDTSKALNKQSAKKVTVKDALYERIRTWRNSKAQDLGVPAYAVLNNSSVEELAQVKPQHVKELENITGIGKMKMSRYGAEIIELIRAFKLEHADENKIKGSTHLKTLELYKKGLSPSEISMDRQLHTTTIFSHLAQLYLQGEDIDLEQYIEADLLEQIIAKWKELDCPDQLKTVKETLDDSVSYADIRLAITIGQKRSLN